MATVSRDIKLELNRFVYQVRSKHLDAADGPGAISSVGCIPPPPKGPHGEGYCYNHKFLFLSGVAVVVVVVVVVVVGIVVVVVVVVVVAVVAVNNTPCMRA